MTEREPGVGGPGEEPEPTLPADEEAAWAQIVAGYGERPELPGTGDSDGIAGDGTDGDRDAEQEQEQDREPDQPVRSFTVYAAGTGPRDWQGGPDDDGDEGHFVPPEPPPLPEADVTTKFAWIAALGGPLLLLAAVLFDIYMTWWILTLGVGGFLGGFATLLTRLREGDDEFEDPGSGAVV